MLLQTYSSRVTHVIRMAFLASKIEKKVKTDGGGDFVSAGISVKKIFYYVVNELNIHPT